MRLGAPTPSHTPRGVVSLTCNCQISLGTPSPGSEGGATLENREPGRKPAGAFSGPRLRQYRVHHGRKIATAPLLFVNYVFVAIVDHWWTASRTPGLRSGCSAGSNRFALTNRRLQDIRSDSLVALSVADANSTPSDP
jgi:hypothetical protein